VSARRILITGAAGFVGRNLALRLRELGYSQVIELTRATSEDEAHRAIAEADFIFHLAGVNRPAERQSFADNVRVTESLCRRLQDAGCSTPIVYSSSIQAEHDNPYGRSKAAAESILADYARASTAPVRSLRLRAIFGKWSRPEYNSVVATFCHRIGRDLPIRIDEGAAALALIYIDDVVAALTAYLESFDAGDAAVAALPVYHTTVGKLADLLRSFRDSRQTLIIEPVGSGFVRALYSTYVSYLPTASFAYPLAQHSDPRGRFIEMLKTRDSGQISFFSAHPGVTRGGHYHHSKTEKFLVIRGCARFRFRHLISGERFELETSGDSPQIVETVPGWAHDITNVGHEEMLVLLWANEIFDRARPDTYKHAV
jgi:UDP-2-acetamido-2,6-beta-L-arabino-hexul-4-ose reductase